jgi:hypothetical protein
LLEELQKSPLLDQRQKDWLRDELWTLRRGIAGERDAAHYIDNHFRDGVNHGVIHDLRISVDGEVAQIDHLLVSRMMHFYLLETKNFGGNVTITEHGEFSVEYRGERVFGVPSPIEQSKRHENVLRKLLDKLEIKARAGTSPRFYHVVLVDPKATIIRPDAKRFDTSMVIKADQFRTWFDKHIDKDVGATTMLSAVINLRGTEAVRELAEKIKRAHRPADILTLPDWIKPKAAAPASATATPPKLRKPAPPPIAATKAEPARKQLICATCGTKISYAEGKFCWNNEKRFGGSQYCREHQTSFK